ncbi:MAG: hypothetical protein V1927_02595 [Candidatus Omnitrophota bacterium]
MSLVVSNIKNPTVTGSTGTYDVQTQNASDAPIDEGTAPAHTVTTGALSNVYVISGSGEYPAGDNSQNYIIGFTTANPVPINGHVKVTFDSDYDLSGAAYVAYPTSTVRGNIASKTGSVLLINLDETSVITAPTAVAIYISGITNPGAIGATSVYFVDTEDTSANGYADIDAGIAPPNIISLGTLWTPSLTPASLKAGAVTSYTITFTTTSAVPVNGDVEVVFDSGYDLSGVLMDDDVELDENPEGAKINGVDNSTKTLSINVKTEISADSTPSLVVSGIKNPTISGETGTFTITTENASDVDMDQGTADGVNITAGELTDASVTAESYLANTQTTYTIAFTAANAVPSGGRVRITFDGDYTITAAARDSSSSHTGAVTTSGNDVIFTLTQQITTASPDVLLVISGITNPATNQTTDDYVITTEYNDSPDYTDIDSGTVTGNDISGRLVSPAVTATSYAAGATPTYTIVFTTMGEIPNGGSIETTFDADYDISGATFDARSNITGSITSKSNTDHILKIQTSQIVNAASPVSLVITGIKNPTYVQAVDTFMIRTKNVAGGIVDSGTASLAQAITTNTLTAGTVTATDYKAGATATYTFPVTLTNALSSGDKIAIALDTDYTVPGSMAVSGDASGTAAFASNTITVTLDAALAAGSAKDVTISGIKNPTYLQTAEAVTITTKKSTGENKDTGTAAAGVSITANVLTSVSVNTVSGTYKAGVTEDYTIAFTTVNPIPVGGRIRVTFDADYDLTGNLAVVSGNTGATADDDTNILVITTGAAVSANTAVSIRISGIRNPTTKQTTVAYSITTKYNDTAPGSDIDMGTASAHNITRYVTVTSPPLDAEWGVSDPTKIISWNSGDNINKVSIYYSTDQENWTAIVANLTPTPTAGGTYSASDSCSYTWSAGIPDLVTSAAQDPQVDRNIATYIKVADVVTTHVDEEDAPDDVSDAFQVCWYQITWNVKDQAILSPLTNLNVNETNDATPPESTWSVTGYSLTSPIVRNYKYDTYTTTFSKEVDYFDGSKNDWTAERSEAFTVYLETSVEKQWFVYTKYTYNSSDDKLYLNVWIEKEGTLMPAPTSAEVRIYDSAGDQLNSTGAFVATTDSPPGTGLSADSNGAFWITVDASNLSSGKTYFAKTSIVYGETTYTSGQSISITVDKALDTISAAQTAEIAYQSAFRTATTATLIVIESATTGVRGKVDAVSSAVSGVSTKVDAVSSAVSGVSTQVNTVNTNVAAILEDTSTTLPTEITSRITTVAEKGVLSEILTRNTTIKEDQSIMVRYRTATGLSPTMTIYDEDGEALSDYDGVTMTEISNTGIYEYEVTCESAWGTGDFTVVCEESTKNSTDSIVLTVKALYVAGEGVEESLDSIGEIVATVQNKTTTLEDLMGTASDTSSADTVMGKIAAVDTTIDNLALDTVATDSRNAKANALKAFTEINNIKTQVNDIQAQVKSVNKMVSSMEDIKADLRKVAAGLTKQPSGAVVPAEIIQPIPLDKEGLAREAQVRDLNNKIEELTAMVKVMRNVVEDTSNKPVIEGWFESE